MMLAVGLAWPVSAASPPLPTNLHLSSPLDWQVFQRFSTTQGIVRVSGSVVEPLPPKTRLEARVRVGGASGEWIPLGELPSGGGSAGFEFQLRAPAGGWHPLELRGVSGPSTFDLGRVEHVGVGEVFVIAGQSNSANHGEERQRPRTGRVSAFSGTEWRVAQDPQPGASGGGGSFIPPFGDAMAERFGVPIGVVAAGAGGTSVREWLPRGSRFPNPPTVTAHVTRLPGGEWENDGVLFARLAGLLRQLGPQGCRAVLWHQGESDANQSDPTRTLPGGLYRSYMERLIAASRGEAGWEVPWFVAQVSYHTPNDPGSPEIREAQAALWGAGIALEGPDSDRLTGDLRDSGGAGIHFSGKGLREHGTKWAEKVAPWLEGRLAMGEKGADGGTRLSRAAFSGRLALPGAEAFAIQGHTAFVYLPAPALRTTPQPWVFYAPTLPGLPDEAERWMHERFLAAGIAVAGVDVGEAYGSPGSHSVFDGLEAELVRERGFARKPCLLGRSRGGLAVCSWAIARPELVAGLAGIYPVFDLRSYPGLEKAAPAYGLAPAELGSRSAELNPVERVDRIARARVPVFLIHGDSDKVVPLKANSGEFVRRYEEAGGRGLVTLTVLPGQDHNMFEGFFRSRAFVDFVIARARAGARE